MKRAFTSLIGLTMILAACGGEGAGEADTTAPPDTTGAPSTTVAAGTTAVATTAATSTTTTLAAAAVFLSVEATWEGEVQTITLYEDGTLIAGSSRGLADISSTDPYWIGLQAGISVVDLGADDSAQAIVVEIPVAEEEDPPNVVQIFVAEGERLRRVLDESYGVYGVTPLSFLGDGTIEYQEDGWTACGREDFPEASNRQIVTLGFVGEELAEIGRRDSADTQICDQLAG